jgi:hypothetical protein
MREKLKHKSNKQNSGPIAHRTATDIKNLKNNRNQHLLVYVSVGRPRETLIGLLGGRYTEALSRHLHRGEYLPYNFGN